MNKAGHEYHLRLMERLAQATYVPWNTLRNDPAMIALEKYRLNHMPLPEQIPNPLPPDYGFVDLTNRFIQVIQARPSEGGKRGRYLPMEELTKLGGGSTPKFQDTIKSILSRTDIGGGVIAAPSGFGKSRAFEYMAQMAAERSLSHIYLWFKGSLRKPEQIKDTSSIKTQHFMFATGDALSQGHHVGSGPQARRHLNEAIRLNPDTFVFCLDEIVSGLSNPDAREGFQGLKTAFSESNVKMIATLATNGLSTFRGYRATSTTKAGEGSVSVTETDERLYNAEMQRRFPLFNIPDYTIDEQIDTLAEKGGLQFQLRERGLKAEKKDESEIIRILVDKTEQVEQGQPVKSWAAPGKWKAIMSAAEQIVKRREDDYKTYINDAEEIESGNDIERWMDLLVATRKEKQEVESDRNINITPENKTLQPATKDKDQAIISLRDVEDALPHEEIDDEAEASQEKRERVQALSVKENAILKTIKRMSEIKRIIELRFKQGLLKLQREYGPDTFSSDMHDIGFLKPSDLERVDASSIQAPIEGTP